MNTGCIGMIRPSQKSAAKNADCYDRSLIEAGRDCGKEILVENM